MANPPKKLGSSISDAEDKFDKFSGFRTLGLVDANIDNSSEEEEEEMALNPRKGLKDFLWGRNKGSSSKKALNSLSFPTLPPLPSPTVGLLPIPNLKKKRKEQEVEEGKVVCKKEAKQ